MKSRGAREIAKKLRIAYVHSVSRIRESDKTVSVIWDQNPPMRPPPGILACSSNRNKKNCQFFSKGGGHYGLPPPEERPLMYTVHPYQMPSATEVDL